MILSVADITFAYNGKPVLKDLTFEARPGEVVAVLGVNGAGKSTLLKCINRILQPRTGTILVGGRELGDMSRIETARHIGYVPQHRADEEIVVFDAVLLGRKPHIRWAATHRDMEITEQVIAQTGLSLLAMRPVNRLSGGEAQKVLIARALAQEPKVLLLDEPTNSLDVRNQLEIMGLLSNLTRARSLVTIVTIHDLNLALRFADRFLLIKDGSISSAVDRNHLSPEMIREAYSIEVVLSEIAGFPIAVPINDTEELTLNKETA